MLLSLIQFKVLRKSSFVHWNKTNESSELFNYVKRYVTLNYFKRNALLWEQHIYKF